MQRFRAMNRGALSSRRSRLARFETGPHLSSASGVGTIRTNNIVILSRRAVRAESKDAPPLHRGERGSGARRNQRVSAPPSFPVASL